jgi:hypothetical protein
MTAAVRDVSSAHAAARPCVCFQEIIVNSRSIRHGINVLCLSLACATLTRASAGDELLEEHHAHEHGVATLDVAVEAAQLVLQFRSPAINLLGFEHRPRSAQDETALSRATAWLRDPTAQFKPPAEAACHIVKSEVTTPDWEHSGDHAEFAASYEFDCRQPAALRHLDVQLLRHLEAGTRIEVQVATTAGQDSAELTHSKIRLPLRTRAQ